MRHLGVLLLVVSIESPEALNMEEVLRALRRLDDDGRHEAARWLKKKLEGAGNDASRLWKERIDQWLDHAWPKEPGLQSSGVSYAFAEAVIFTGDTFPEAVARISPLVGPIDHGWRILTKLKEKGHVERFPAASLELIDKLIDDHPPRWFGDLNGFLDDVRGVDQQLESDGRFQRLKEITVREKLLEP
jgi:hypothetical protein